MLFFFQCYIFEMSSSPMTIGLNFFSSLLHFAQPVSLIVFEYTFILHIVARRSAVTCNSETVKDKSNLLAQIDLNWLFAREYQIIQRTLLRISRERFEIYECLKFFGSQFTIFYNTKLCNSLFQQQFQSLSDNFLICNSVKGRQFFLAQPLILQISQYYSIRLFPAACLCE